MIKVRVAIGAFAAVLLAFALLAPVADAASPMAHTGRVLISTEGDVVVPAGDHADVVVVVHGTATVRGEVNTLVVVDGTANVAGATLETLVAVSSQVEIGDGTTISGELQRFDSTVHQAGNVAIEGGVVDLGSRFLDAGRVLAPIFLLLWLGFGLATIVAGLLLAALVSSQVRAAARLIAHEPVMTGVTGILSVIVIPVIAIVLLATVIGAPLGMGILLVALPMLAFVGYLVAAVWVGDWLLGLFGSRQERERPYLAVVVGVVVLGAIGFVPVLGLLSAIAGLFGFGAVIVMALRTISAGPHPSTNPPQAMPIAAGA